jgi:hypothetical protein
VVRVLDFSKASSYLASMKNNPTHPPIYYKVRSVVRFCFWTGLIAGLMVISSWITGLNNKPECPVTLNFDFTYTAHADFDPNECTAGHNVSLLDGYRWGWTN